ncbi:MAG: PilX N-terminal domain-containing pilus assembly protein [Rhodoferax sp.]|uniref:pilus assembly PilX family protein n=1 Tax=Rhodoferax sp. TaxID=50421 RepID=UPI002ACD4A84|nr:PilX N-terminal domain-containing pilus assembly protein [Rhodoferax sp.]MDZ7892004.1 PilX N-terminal domain-containing pilus assembly protein [Rhodoferax sp.]
MSTHFFRNPAQRSLAGQKGSSLIVVLMILTVVSIAGIAGVQISMLSERSARSDRDMQVAWQSAEAALVDAENDIFGPGTSTRRALFNDPKNISDFVDGCGSTANSVGLCAMVSSGKPAWLTVDFEATTSARTTEYGQYTLRTLQTGSGIQPFRSPRYVIEPIRDPADRDLSNPTPAHIYRVTAMGFGPRLEAQAVLQMIYRK